MNQFNTCGQVWSFLSFEIRLKDLSDRWLIEGSLAGCFDKKPNQRKESKNTIHPPPLATDKEAKWKTVCFRK